MRLSSYATAAAVLSVTLAAHADDIFTLSDGTNTITFELPSSPTVMPSSACPTNPNYFCVTDVGLTVNGITTTSNYIAFYTLAESGGLAIEQDAGFVLSQQGPALFTGSTDAPMFLPQTFNLTNLPPTLSEFTSDFAVTITPTPEPSSFALLGTGLLGVAGAMKRRFA